VFLCSDGISDLIQEGELLTVLRQQKNLDSSLEVLKSLAYQRGANDNLSMIVVKIPTTSLPVTRKQKWIHLLLFALILLVAAFIGICLGWLVLNKPL